MQTPMKYALALLAAVALLAPITSATPPHSQSIIGHYTLGSAEIQAITGVCNNATVQTTTSGATTNCITLDACLDSSYQGTTSNCAKIFPEETGKAYTIVANGVKPTLGLAISAATFSACAAPKIAGDAPGALTTYVSGTPTPSTPPDPSAVFNASDYLTGPASDAFITHATDRGLRCNLDGAFTKLASDLGLKACFFTAAPAVTLIGCQNAYDYKGDLSGTIPAGTSTMSVTSSLGTATVSWWFYTGTI